MDQQSFNSTRLSLAIGDLPLTPFGMRSPFAKKIEDKCNGLTKLSSNRKQYSPKSCNIFNPEIINEANSKKFQNVNRIRRKISSVGDKITSSSEETLFENVINIIPAYSVPDALYNENWKCSESNLTDIDDGNFVEFNEATRLPNDEVMNELHSYYTCLSQNETKFSTSSKLANTEIAFRKFVDKATYSAFLTHIGEEEIFFNKKTKEFPIDETVIVASKNISVKNTVKSNVMNSTMKSFGVKASDELPDLSSLTLEEITYSSAADNVKDATILLPTGKKTSKISAEKVNSKVIFPAQISQQSLISEDVSLSSLNESLTSSQRFAIFPSSSKAKQVQSYTSNNQNPIFMEHCHKNLEKESKIDDGRIKEWILTSPFKSSSFQSQFLNESILSNNELYERNYACDISQDLQLQLSLVTAASNDELLPNPNGTIITIAKVARSPIENNSATLKDTSSSVSTQTKDVTRTPSSSSSSSNISFQKSLASQLCIMKKVITSPSDDEASLIYSSDEDIIANEKVLRRISLSTPNLRNWERGKLSIKHVEIKSDANSNEGTCTKTKDYSSESNNLHRYNFKSYKCINKYSDSISAEDINDVPLWEEKTRKAKLRKSLSFCDEKESKNDLQVCSKKNSDLTPSINQFQPKSCRNETVLISDSSSYSQSSAEDETPCKNRNGFSNEFSFTKLSKKCNILQSNYNVNNDVVHRKKNKRIKFPVFKLSSDSDDDSVSCNSDIQNSRNKVGRIASSNFENYIIKDGPKQNPNNSVPVEKINDKYLSSDSDDDFDTYVNKWKNCSGKKTLVHRKNNSTSKPKESSFLVDSDDSGEDVEFYLQHINKQPLSSDLFTKEKKEQNLNFQKLPHVVTHDNICGLEKEDNSCLQNLPYKDDLKNLVTLQVTSSDSEVDDHSNIFRSKKTKKNKVKLIIATPKFIDNTSSSSAELQKKINRPLSFLASLSLEGSYRNAHPDSLPYLKNFKKNKVDLAIYLYDYYNKHIFDYKLPKEMKITWNVRLTKTAGQCCYQVDKSSAVGRSARIVMSVKVCDGPARLRDTLIHEVCHAAAWIISGYNGHHGKLWRAWASKAMRTFPELPIIDRCHTYEIKCKYTYKCVKCGYSFGRHSKSLDMERKVCGICKGRFELVVNYTKKHENFTTATPRAPNAFALFVKENYSVAKKNHSEFKHGDIMKQLSEQFRNLKTK